MDIYAPDTERVYRALPPDSGEGGDRGTGLCLWDAGNEVTAMPFFWMRTTDSEYVQWLNLYRNNPQGFL